MSAISTRQPNVDIEYDCHGVRKRKSFKNSYQAKSFYTIKFNLGKNPSVKKQENER